MRAATSALQFFPQESMSDNKPDVPEMDKKER